MIKYIKLVLPLFFVTACSVTPIEGSSSIEILTSKPNLECKNLGDVGGDSGFWGTGFSVAESMKNARAAIRNKAAELGANTIVLQTNNQHYERVVLVGNAYYCAK